MKFSTSLRYISEINLLKPASLYLQEDFIVYREDSHHSLINVKCAVVEKESNPY
jgi:hypothetical protein